MVRMRVVLGLIAAAAFILVLGPMRRFAQRRGSPVLRQTPVVLHRLLGFALGVWACNVAGRALGVDDHRSLVWDEFIGQWIALIPLLLPALLPARGFAWWMLLAGFVLFRLFDVWKPWPISWLDRHLKGGMGVMVDDVVAGVFAAVVLGLALSLTR